MKLRSKLEDQKEIFRQRGAVAVYLYGSYAEGRQHRESDIDVAVLFEDYRGLEQLVELETELDDCFEKELDVRSLNTDDIVFRKEVISNGELVFESEKSKRIDFEESVMKHYLDMKPYIQRYYRKRSGRLEALKT